jgi:uncharacterized protein
MSENIQLQSYLRQLEPILAPDKYVFISVPYDFAKYHVDITSLLIQQCLSLHREKEGLSLVITQNELDKFTCKFQRVSKTSYGCITLNVLSDLESVGLTAAVAQCLADIGVSANMIAGYFHDHILIPSSDVEKAFLALSGLTAR